MRGKRSKQYRKLMNQYQVTFNFREPYQVLVDSQMVLDCAKFKMDMLAGMKRTLHGEVKPMITTCSMRHLYSYGDQDAIATAKTYERRRCNHHELAEPLSTLSCLKEVVDPKQSNTNKHRYIVASQDPDVRAHMRTIAGVPLVYVSRSVMIMEPMAEATDKTRLKEERSKFRQGLKMRLNANTVLGKRARDDSQEHDDERNTEEGTTTKKKKRKGPKGPNPLSVLKPKRRVAEAQPTRVEPTEKGKHASAEEEGPGEKRKRKRKSSKKADGTAIEPVD